jgi:hypothetical protein
MIRTPRGGTVRRLVLARPATSYRHSAACRIVAALSSALAPKNEFMPAYPHCPDTNSS